MTEIATINWFGRWGTSVFSVNTAVFIVIIAKSTNERLSLILEKISYDISNIDHFVSM